MAGRLVGRNRTEKLNDFLFLRKKFQDFRLFYYGWGHATKLNHDLAIKFRVQPKDVHFQIVMDRDQPRRHSCPFRKRSLPFLRHLRQKDKIFDLLLKAFLLKRKNNRSPRSNLDLEPRPFVS